MGLDFKNCFDMKTKSTYVYKDNPSDYLGELLLCSNPMKKECFPKSTLKVEITRNMSPKKLCKKKNSKKQEISCEDDSFSYLIWKPSGNAPNQVSRSQNEM